MTTSLTTPVRSAVALLVPILLVLPAMAQAACDATPKNGCLTAERAQLQVKNNSNDTKDQLQWKWQQGQELQQSDLGDPVGTTDYVLCVYDSVVGVPALVATLTVPPSGLWQNKDPKGWLYKDKLLSQDGVQQIQLKTGSGDKSAAKLKAKGANVPMPVPAGPSQFFTQDPIVTVQLDKQGGSGPSTCWTSEFTASQTTKNDGVQFKANAK